MEETCYIVFNLRLQSVVWSCSRLVDSWCTYTTLSKEKSIVYIDSHSHTRTHRYSTCSLNPIENTAVVAELIRNAQGAVEILDVTKILPKIKYEPGHQTWKVMVSKGDRIFQHWKDVPEDDAKLQNCLTKSMFPPSSEEAKKLGL